MDIWWPPYTIYNCKINGILNFAVIATAVDAIAIIINIIVIY